MDNFRKELGENISKYRNAINMSTTILSELSGISQGTISKIENGLSSPTIETLIKICKALGTSLYQVLPGYILPGLKVDSPYKRDFLKLLDEIPEDQVKIIQILLASNIIPTLRTITPIVKAVEQLSESEQKQLEHLLNSLANNH